MNLQLRSTTTFSAQNGVKVVVYGRAGMGKTRLCSTCPSPVIFSAESGLMSLAAYDLPYYELKTVEDLRGVYAWAKGSAEARQFQTICLDSISDIGETMLAAMKKGKKDPRMAYGEFNDEMLQVLKDFRDLPGKHVYMSAKQDRFKSPDGSITNSPSMPGQRMGQALPYLPDLILQADRHPTDKYYYLRTRADFANDAKDRSGRLDEIERPDLGYIFNKIMGRAA